MNSKQLIKKIIFYSSIIIMSIIIIGYIYAIYKFPSITKDSGYYLKISYDLANNLSFYNGLNCSYTPMAMYLLSIPFYFMNDVGLDFIFAFFLFFYIIIGLLFYRLSFYFNKDYRINIFSTFLLVSLLLSLEGFHILLEPFVLLFQISSILILLKYNASNKSLILVGFFVFLSFFSKQYGLFVFPAIVYFIFQSSKKYKRFIKKICFLIAGILFPLIVFVLYFFVYKNIEFTNLMSQLLGIQVFNGDEIVTDVNYSFKGFVKNIKRVIKLFPFFIFYIFLIPLAIKRKLTTNTVFSLLLFFGSVLTLIFAYWLHYFQLIIPYAILTVISLPQNVLKKYSLLFGVCFIVFVKASYNEFNRAVNKKETLYNRQKLTVNILDEYLKKADNVYLHGISASYYFLCKYNSPNYQILGYKFPEELTLKKIDNSLSRGDYIIINSKQISMQYVIDYEFITKFLYANKELTVLKK